jgi:hypothetical protein
MNEQTLGIKIKTFEIANIPNAFDPNSRTQFNLEQDSNSILNGDLSQYDISEKDEYSDSLETISDIDEEEIGEYEDLETENIISMDNFKKILQTKNAAESSTAGDTNSSFPKS